jgi:hypothetical protein
MIKDPAWRHALTTRKLNEVKQPEGWFITVAAAGWDLATLRKELLDNNVRPIQQEVEDGQCPEFKDITDNSPIYNK